MSKEGRILSPKHLRVGDAVNVQAFGKRVDARVAGFRPESVIDALQKALSGEDSRNPHLKHRLKVVVELQNGQGLVLRPHKVHAV